MNSIRFEYFFIRQWAYTSQSNTKMTLRIVSPPPSLWNLKLQLPPTYQSCPFLFLVRMAPIFFTSLTSASSSVFVLPLLPSSIVRDIPTLTVIAPMAEDAVTSYFPNGVSRRHLPFGLSSSSLDESHAHCLRKTFPCTCVSSLLTSDEWDNSQFEKKIALCIFDIID